MDGRPVIIPNQSSSPKSMLKALVVKLGMRAKSAISLFIARRKFYAKVVRAAGSGQLSPEVRLEIEKTLKDLGLELKDLWGVRVRAYKAALKSVKRNRQVTADMEIDMDQIQGFLQIPYGEIEKQKIELDRLRLLSEIRIGNIPLLISAGIILQKGESAYWSESGALLEERVVGRRYEGGSSGVSIRIAKGVSYRVGNHRGRMVTDKALLEVSHGRLIVTNKRIVFSGDAKSFDVKLDKILNVTFLSDGLVFNTGGRERPYAVRLSNPKEIEIVRAILEVAMKRFAA